MSDYNELCKLVNTKLSTGITQYPTGKFGIVGSIPVSLTKSYTSGFTTGRTSKVWDNEQDVVTALLAAGVVNFQLSDCSWYKPINQ